MMHLLSSKLFLHSKYSTTREPLSLHVCDVFASDPDEFMLLARVGHRDNGATVEHRGIKYEHLQDHGPRQNAILYIMIIT